MINPPYFLKLALGGGRLYGVATRAYAEEIVRLRNTEFFKESADILKS